YGTSLTTDGYQGLCHLSEHHLPAHQAGARTFTYDHVSDMDYSVFSSVAKNIVCLISTTSLMTNGGVIPLCFEYLLFLISKEVERSGNAKSFLCNCSFIEIYNKQVYDLLDSASANLFLRENIKNRVFVEGAVEKFVTSAAEANKVLSMGWCNWRVACISMNRESSRSYAGFTMTLQSKETAKEVVNIRTSQLNLVDLAGLERQRDTQSEASRINHSLVIMALVDDSNGKRLSWRAKLIKNKVSMQIWAEVKKLKEQLALALSTQTQWGDVVPGGLQIPMGKTLFLEDVRLWKKLIHIHPPLFKFRRGAHFSAWALFDQVNEDIRILCEQVQYYHPKMTFYAAENYSLREENQQLRSLASVRRAEEAAGQTAAELEEDFQRVLETERSDGEKRYLDKSNKHLENILEATKAHKKQEVSQLNNIHVETIKIFTTPTEPYNLRTRLMPLSSPNYLNENGRGDEDVNDIQTEQPPPEMIAITCEALTEELQPVQVQTQLNQQELRSRKLLQQFSKLEGQVTGMLESSRKDMDLSFFLGLYGYSMVIETNPFSLVILKSEVHDLHLLLQSSDRELAFADSSHPITFSLLLFFRREWEQPLEQQRSLQDAFDQIQAEAKFEADQSRQQLEDNQQDIIAQQAQITVSQLLFKPTKELVQNMEQNVVLRKQVSDWTTQNQKQTCHSFITSNVASLEPNLTTANGTISCLEKKIEQEKVISCFVLFVLELINQTRDLCSKLGQKDQGLAMLSADVKDLADMYNAPCAEREEIKEHNSRMQAELQDLREAAERKVEVLQEELVYATEEVERLTKVLDEQAGLLQASQDQTAQKEATTLQGKVLGHFFSMHIQRATENKSRSQEKELESRRSSMMTMEVPLTELNYERAAKNEEIQKLKGQLNEKEMVRMESQAVLDEFYAKQNQLAQNGNTNGLRIVIQRLTEAQERYANNTLLSNHTDSILTSQESLLAQSQTSVQELRNRCLEVSRKEPDQERLLHVRRENCKLVGHKNYKQRIEYLVKLKEEHQT
uniref:Kinesin family member 15 n=1 Tax=Hucho hucho TaxID=62062 RepID=A0A4W5RKE0_9TELE